MADSKKTLIDRWDYMEEVSSEGGWNGDFHEYLIDAFQDALRNNQTRKTVGQMLTEIEKKFKCEISE